MKIEILQLKSGARQARGCAVIIDVFRAFSTACYVVANGAARIVPVATPEEALALKQAHPSFILLGEDKGRELPGFDYGNSPTKVEQVNFAGRTVVHRSSAGTQGLVNAHHADEVLTGSFCNAGAVVAYIEQRQPQTVSLVCMGTQTIEPAAEDTLCAEYIAARLQGQSPPMAPIRAQLRQYHSARKFFDPAATWAPERDFELCLAANQFDFVLRLQQDEDGLQALHRVPVSG